MNTPTERELLELAAKAAGLPECGWMADAFFYVKENTFTEWNPLTDDGDALRLAVKLGMMVDQMEDTTEALLPHWHCAAAACMYSEPRGDNPCAATRRAITRAAAAVGKAMP